MRLETPICDFNWRAPDFTLRDPKGQSHTLSDYQGGKGVLVMFVCNHCPYVKAVADRLAGDADDLMAQGINVLAVMSNDYRDYPADSPKMMLDFAAQHGWNFPYLLDEGQSVGKAYGAVCTPDFFGFNKDGGLQYRGRLDDAGRHGDPEGRKRELVEAMLQIAETGEGPREQVLGMGCSIKWRR